MKLNIKILQILLIIQILLGFDIKYQNKTKDRDQFMKESKIKYFLLAIIPLVAYWVISMEILIYPFFFGEYQLIMLGVGFVFAMTGVFIILLLIQTIRRMS